MRRVAYGASLAADVPVAGFPLAATGPPPDIDIRLNSPPSWLEPALAVEREPFPEADFISPSGDVIRSVFRPSAGGGCFQLKYEDRTEFFVADSGRSIYGRWTPPNTLADTLTYVLGPILGIALRLLGRCCLHASAVALDDRAIMFIGPAGSGKSTTAAALALAGARLLTDDIVVIREADGQFWIEPGHAWLRLWPSSVRLLCGSEESLPLLTPNWDKRYLDATHTSAPRAVPLGHVVLLGGFDSRSQPEPLLTAAAPRETMLWLSGNTYASPFIDAAARRREFDLFGRIARDVPATVLRHWAEDVSVEQLVRRILDCTSRTPQHPCTPSPPMGR